MKIKTQVVKEEVIEVKPELVIEITGIETRNRFGMTELTIDAIASGTFSLSKLSSRRKYALVEVVDA